MAKFGKPFSDERPGSGISSRPPVPLEWPFLVSPGSPSPSVFGEGVRPRDGRWGSSPQGERDSSVCPVEGAWAVDVTGLSRARPLCSRKPASGICHEQAIQGHGERRPGPPAPPSCGPIGRGVCNGRVPAGAIGHEGRCPGTALVTAGPRSGLDARFCFGVCVPRRGEAEAWGSSEDREGRGPGGGLCPPHVSCSGLLGTSKYDFVSGKQCSSEWEMFSVAGGVLGTFDSGVKTEPKPLGPGSLHSGSTRASQRAGPELLSPRPKVRKTRPRARDSHPKAT